MSPRSRTASRVLLVADRQQGGEVADVLLEVVEHRGDEALAEPDPGPDALLLELLRPGVGGLLEQRDAGLPPQLLAEEERRVGAERHLDAGDALRGVPVGRVVLRADLQVELGAGAGRLRRDRVGVHVQPLGAVDGDVQVLAARGEDLLVDQRVARVGGDRLGGDVLGVEGRQRADHDDVRPDRPGALLGLVEAVPQLRLELRGGRAGQRRRAHVHLDVELAHLGLEDLVGDRGEDLLVAHRRVLLGVDQVELDLHAGQRPLEVELRLVEHPAEHVQAAPQLLPVAQAVPAGERPGLDLFAHAGRLPSVPRCAVRLARNRLVGTPGRAAASRPAVSG